MIEGALFMLDLVFVTLLCLGIKRVETKQVDGRQLGIFAYDDESED